MKAWPFLLFLVAGLACTWQGLFGGKFLLLRDLQGYFHPWSVYKLRTLVGGEFPLWNPYSLFGQPFLANPQTGILYPLSYIYGLIPFSRGITVYVLVHLLIGSTGMYWFCRELGLGRAGAALAAITYAFGGWMVKMWEFASVLGAVSWAPLFLAVTQRAFKGKLKGLLLGGAAILATQVFAGYPMMVAFTLFAAGCLVLSRVILPGGKRKRALITLGTLAVACVIAVMLSLFQLAPTAELASGSPRGLTPTFEVSGSAFSLHPAELANFLVPYLFGFPDWQKSFYIGLLPLMLAVFGLISSRHFARKQGGSYAPLLFTCGLVLLGTSVALGKYTPVYGFLSRTIGPFGSLVTWPSVAMFFPYVGIGILAGIGLDSLLHGPSFKNRLTICLIAATFVLAALALALKPQLVDIFRTKFRIEVLAFRNPSISPSRFPPGSVAIGFLITSVLSGAGLLFAGLGRIKRSARIALLLAVAMVDLSLFGAKQVFFSPQNLYAQEPQLVSQLGGEGEVSRLARHPLAEFLNDLLYGSRSVQDFSSAAELMRADMGLLYRIFRVYGWRALASNETLRIYQGLNFAKLDNLVRLRLLALCNVKHFVNMVREGPSFYPSLAATPSYLPRAFFVSRARGFKDPDEVLQIMSSPDFDPERELLLLDDDGDIEYGDSPPQSGAAWVGDIRYTANTVRLRCKAEVPGFVFISDSYYPGWHAYVNDQETKIHRANHAFRAVRVPEGESEIAFVYKPGWFVPAAAITGASWVLLFACSLVLGLRRWVARGKSVEP